MHDIGCTRSARTLELEEHVLREFEEQPETTMRAVSTGANVSQMTVWRRLGVGVLRPYHAQRVKALKASDHQPRVDFSRWFFQQLAGQLDFAAHVLFADECSFRREGIFNVQCTQLSVHEPTCHPSSFISTTFQSQCAGRSYPRSFDRAISFAKAYLVFL